MDKDIKDTVRRLRVETSVKGVFALLLLKKQGDTPSIDYYRLYQ